MLLENMTYQAVEKYLEEKQVILLPTGSVEQHSPYGLLGTDFITAEGVAREAASRLELLVAPALQYGVSSHHMEFCGSVTLAPMTFVQMLLDIYTSFLRHGFNRIFIINGHGGNKSAIDMAFQELKHRGVAGQFAQIAWYEGLQETKLIQELFQEQDGQHATPSEISLSWTLRPDAFRSIDVAPGEVLPRDYYWPLSAREMRQVFPDGRMGAASWLASREKGKIVMSLAVEYLCERIEDLCRLPLLEV